MKVLVLVAYSAIICGVVLLIAIIVLLIAIVNYMTKGKLSKLVLCQNSPTAWYQTPNFHLGNKFDRSLFCKTPCVAGFSPDTMTGSFCAAVPNGEPSFCPQAEIMRIISNYSRNDRVYMYPGFNVLSTSLSKPEEKEKEFKEYFQRKKRHLQKCKSSLGNYEPLALSVCTHLDMLKATKYHGLTDKDIARLEDVCRQSFCDSSSRYFFCGGQSLGNTNMNETDNRTTTLIKSIVTVLLLTCIFLIALAFTYSFVQAV